jgi:nitrite reductase (NADH) small subunit
MHGLQLHITEGSVIVVHNLGPASRIPLGEGRMFVVEGREIAVFRAREGAIYATQAYCSHRDGPLADGIVGDGKVVCPLHSFVFDLATGDPVGNSCLTLETFDVRLNDDEEILLSLEQPVSEDEEEESDS